MANCSCLLLLLLICNPLPAAEFVSKQPDASDPAITLGRDLDGDGDVDEVEIHLEVIEVQQEVYPGEYVTFWVFAPEGRGMISRAILPSPTLRVEQGDRVSITLHNTHYFPHTIHLHGAIHDNAVDGVPDITQAAVNPGESFTYEFIAKNPGTHFYHCHVRPDVHVLMGLVGMLIIEPNRPDNRFSHLVPGAGLISDPAKAVKEEYQREYSLVYLDIDDRLNRILDNTQDPREIEKRMHREYDSAQRQPNIFLLNGRSFPYTLHNSTILVDPEQHTKLRILNAGASPLSLHSHGHHPTVTHQDGYELAKTSQASRDVFHLSAAQRIDLDLNTSQDAHSASGPGVWLLHDHQEQNTTNKGIGPGGDLTAIVYPGYLTEQGLPKVATSLERFFNPDFYRGKIPTFDPAIFHTPAEDYEFSVDTEEPAGRAKPYPEQVHRASRYREPMAQHEIVATSCAKPGSVRAVHIKAGSKYAREGEVFGFEPRMIKAEPCEVLEITLENTDSVRHALMFPGLNPMFTLEFRGPGLRTARLVVPDKDVTLEFHCHVETHEKMGMFGQLIVGKGSTPEPTLKAKYLFKGRGRVLEVDKLQGRVVLEHDEIKGYMAAMTMSYQVKPAQLLKGIKPGEWVIFVLDSQQRRIVKLHPEHDF